MNEARVRNGAEQAEGDKRMSPPERSIGQEARLVRQGGSNELRKAIPDNGPRLGRLELEGHPEPLEEEARQPEEHENQQDEQDLWARLEVGGFGAEPAVQGQAEPQHEHQSKDVQNGLEGLIHAPLQERDPQGLEQVSVELCDDRTGQQHGEPGEDGEVHDARVPPGHDLPVKQAIHCQLSQRPRRFGHDCLRRTSSWMTCRMPTRVNVRDIPKMNAMANGMKAAYSGTKFPPGRL